MRLAVIARIVSATPLSLRIPALPAIPIAWKTIPDGYLSYLLPLGLSAIALAQLIFSLGDQRGLPGLGVFAILLGICAIALWTAVVGRSAIPGIRPEGTVATSPAPETIKPGSNRLKVAGLVLGAGMSGFLLFRVASGHDNTWDIALWLATIAAFATVFIPGRHWKPGAWNPFGLPRYVWGIARRNWRGMLPLVVILVVYCTLTIPNLTAWRYAALGDEYLFYEHAKSVIENGTTKPFSQNGVYDNNPEFNTLYQAAWMHIFGDDHFGWKITGVASMVLSISGMYALGGLLAGRTAAVAAAGFFAASHYLMGLLNGGYNHLDALPVTVFALTMFVLGVRRKNPLLLFLAGAAAGLGFYFHYAARIVGPVMLLAAAVSVRPREYVQLWPVLFGGLVTAWPTFLIAQEAILTKMFAQTVAGYSEAVAGPVGERVLSNVKLNLPAFHFNGASHTYVSGPLLDPLTGALAATGVGIAIGTLRGLAARICLIWLGLAFVATGLTSPYPTTAITRLFPLVPPLALLAGMTITVGHALATRLLPRLPGDSFRFAAPIVLVAALASVFWLNQDRALFSTYEKFHYTREALATGAFRSPHCNSQLDRTVFVGTHPESTLSKAINSYDPGGPEVNVIPFEEFDVGDSLPNPACVIIHNTGANEAFRVMAELQRRYPAGTFYTYTTPSRKSSVEYFHIPQT